MGERGNPRDSGELVQGTLDMLILRTLARGPSHGWGVAQHIKAVSDEVLRVEEGSLYPALHKLEQEGWITAEWKQTENNRKAKFYSITRKGKARLGEQLEAWDRLVDAMSLVLGRKVNP